MRAAGLFLVLALAKVLSLQGREVEWSVWTLPAYLWQDVWVALTFAAVDALTRRAWLSWTVYSLLVAYSAFNVALVNVLSTPMTFTMFRAARGAITDSIRLYLTVENGAMMAAVVFAGSFVAFSIHRLEQSAEQRNRAAPVRSRRWLASIGAWSGLLMVALGPTASARVDTTGLHRNAVVALLASAMPRVPARHFDADWRRSPFASPPGEDLTRLRGAAEGKNVVIISLESTGARHLKPYGASADPTPNLTALAREAILFEHACAVYPESIKGLFSTLGSRYPAFGESPEAHARTPMSSIATVLGSEGYRTALFHSGRFDYLGMGAIVNASGFEIREDAGLIGGNRQSSFGVDEPATVARMLAWLDSLPREQKFFLTYLPIAGHHPYDAPGNGPFPAKDELGCHLNALHYGDASLGELISGLKARGLFEQTLFVFHGDHGEAFGEHEGNHGHTLFIHEENIHVPLMIVAPGLVREPVRIRRVASLVDVAPTITELLGLTPPALWQGASQLSPEPRLALFFTDYSLGLLGLRDTAWKFTLELDSGRMKLFDLQTDPEERRNLAPAMPERATAYRDHVKRWASAQKASVRDAGR